MVLDSVPFLRMAFFFAFLHASKMLSHSSIQISYFAAGIVSHLACLPDDVWFSAQQYNKSEFIRVLVSCFSVFVMLLVNYNCYC